MNGRLRDVELRKEGKKYVFVCRSSGRKVHIKPEMLVASSFEERRRRRTGLIGEIKEKKNKNKNEDLFQHLI